MRKITSLQLRRSQLAAYCRLTLCGVLELYAASDIFKYYNKVGEEERRKRGRRGEREGGEEKERETRRKGSRAGNMRKILKWNSITGIIITTVL